MAARTVDPRKAGSAITINDAAVAATARASASTSPDWLKLKNPEALADAHQTQLGGCPDM